MTLQYKDIAYELNRSERKTASIYIERDGRISVLAPDQWSEEQVEHVLERKRPWIYRGLAEWEDLNATRVEREFVSGEGFLYLGSSYRLALVEKQSAPLAIKDGWFCLRADGVNRAQQVFKEFYREKGIERIPKRVAYFERKLGVASSGVRVMELHHRWASCSADGTINFHWKCMMAPLRIMDYIVAHELVHLLHDNHTDAFWNTLDKVMPEYRERKEWLRVNGAGMDL
jgi:hypothetical protein